MATQYWNKREAMWWAASGVALVVLAVMVVAFGFDPAAILFG
jgi:hypothetical protein